MVGHIHKDVILFPSFLTRRKPTKIKTLFQSSRNEIKSNGKKCPEVRPINIIGTHKKDAK